MSEDAEPREMAPEYDFSAAERGRYAGRAYVDPSTPAGTQVVLRRPLPEHGLEKGDVGRIVESAGPGLTIQFRIGAADEGIVVDLAPGDLRLPTESEVLHVRETRAP